MKIISIRPAPPGAGSLRARFDVEFDAGLRLFNLALKDTTNGWRCFAPSAFGAAAATFTPAVAADLIHLARTKLGEIRRDRSAA